MNIEHKDDYRKRRAEEYPAITDQLDELWKLLDGMKVDSSVLDQIKAIKVKYAKQTA